MPFDNTPEPPASTNAFRSICNKPDRFHFGNLLTTGSFPHDWVYEGIVERGKITRWDGRESDNSTPDALALACCLASGAPFKHRQSVQGRRKVIIYDALNDFKEIAGHVDTCCKVKGFNRDVVAMWLMILGPAYFTPVPRGASDKQCMANIEKLTKEALENDVPVIELLNLPSSIEDSVFRGRADGPLARALLTLASAANVGIIAHFQEFSENFAYDHHYGER